MKIEDRKTAMREAILSVPLTGRGYNDFVNDIVEKLTELGAFIPPVKIGETVYAALDSVLGEPPSIEPWVVKGYGVDREGKWFVEDSDGEQYYVGTNYCVLDKEIAERQLAVYMQAYRDKAESDEVEECLERMNKVIDSDLDGEDAFDEC